MTHIVCIELELPDDLARFHLPPGVDARLSELLDRQDRGETLSAREREEAEGLVYLAETLSLLRLRAERTVANGAKPT
ncbi:MAG TPA: hypothetical protein VMV10_13235 [Pirellulales bacterium]|nr:hypothetical protein [Pirellulales bacterium]